LYLVLNVWPIYFIGQLMHFIYAVLFIFVCLCIWFQYVLYGVFRLECNFYVCIFKGLC
jgi:hypothetical protein